LNGRFQNVQILGNKLYHGELAGLSLIGVQDCLVSHNEIYGNNRQAIVIYDYKDGWYDPNNPATVQEWLKTHHPNQNITICNNSIIQGPHQYKVDPWHYNDPTKNTAILINNEVHPEIGCYPPKAFVIRNNVIWSPNDLMVHCYHHDESVATRFLGNIVWTTKPSCQPRAKGPYPPGTFDITYLQQAWPYWYWDNLVMDPGFVQIPQYAFIDLTANPHYNWGLHVSQSNLYSKCAAELHKGKDY